jgi:hypothetical protein
MSMTLQVVAAVVVCYLTGALLLRLPIGDRSRRAALDPEERVFWGVLISATLSSVIVLILAAASAYTFRRLVFVNGAISLLILALFRQRLLWPSTATPLRWTAVIPGALVAVGLWLYLPPSEYVIGGRDPGVYFNEGIRIAQRGALIVNDPVIAAVPEETRQLFMRTAPGRRVNWGLRFMGTFILDSSTGAIRSQFPHLFPTSIAIGYGLDGLTGARRTLAFWGILGVLALYFLGTRLFGRAVGGAAACLLAIHVVQVWFARYPASEIMMQPLLLAGTLAYARAHQDDDGFFAPIAGWLLALPFIFRVEAALVLVAVFGAIVAGLIDGRRPRFWFLVVFIVTFALAGLYLAEVTTAYFRYPMTVVRGTFRRLPLAGWMLLAVAAICLAPVAYVTAVNPRVRALVRRWLPALLSLAVVAAAVYGYFWRTESRSVADYDVAMLRDYAAFYVTVPGLIAALIGYAITARRAFWRDPAFVITATLFAMFYFYKMRIVPEHFWLMRRLLPIVLPATLLFAAAAALFAIQRWGQTSSGRVRQAISAAIGIVFLAFIARQYAAATAPVARHVEYAGVIPQLERMSAGFDDRSLYIVESRNASDLHVLALPLAFIYADNVLLLRSPTPDKRLMERFIEAARQRYENVYFLGGSGTDFLTPRIAVERVRKENFSIPEYEQPRESYPRGVRLKAFDFGIYRFVDPKPEDERLLLDMDESDDVSVLRFYAPESNGDDVYRWSSARSLVTVLGIRPDRRTVTMWMSSGGRPAAGGPAVVRVAIEGQTLGEVTVTDGFHPYTFEIPLGLAGQIADKTGSARLSLLTSTWTPSRILGGTDDRELGVMVSRVEIK